MELLKLHDVSLSPGGRGLSLVLEDRQSLAVMGPGASGKSRLLRCFLGIERPARGTVELKADAAVADLSHIPKRTTPQTLARKAGGTPSSIAEALTALRLWNQRFAPLRDLSPSQLAACAVLEVLASPLNLLLIDGQLDLLDPWALDGSLALLRTQLSRGASAIVATNRADVAAAMDLLVVLQNGETRFTGTQAELLRSGPTSRLEVRTNDAPGARALTDPFEVSVREVDGGLEIRTREGQQVAAKLALEGYGDVHLIHLREPTVEEALLSLFA